MTREERRQRRERFKAKAKSPNTLKAYRHAWSRFGTWCEAEGIDPLKATGENVADFYADLADGWPKFDKPKARQTVLAMRNGMRFHFRKAGVADPTADPEAVGVLEGVSRETGETKGQAAGLRLADAEAIYKWNPPKDAKRARRLWVRRGKTAIAVMRDAMLRVSEAAALDWSDVTWPDTDPVTGETHDDQRGKIKIRRSKTDQHGRGVTRSISPRTVNALRLWAVAIRAADNADDTPEAGSVFGVGGHCLANDIRKLANAAGVVPEGKHVSSHSCRIGMTVDLYVGEAGAGPVGHEDDYGVGPGLPIETIRVAGRWKTTQMVRYYLREYLGELDPLADTFVDPMADAFGSYARRPLAGSPEATAAAGSTG